MQGVSIWVAILVSVVPVAVVEVYVDFLLVLWVSGSFEGSSVILCSVGGFKWAEERYWSPDSSRTESGSHCFVVLNSFQYLYVERAFLVAF